MENKMKEKLNIQVGDEVVTNIGKTYIVGEIIKDEFDGRDWIFPYGGHEYTYLIPVENVVSIKRKVDDDLIPVDLKQERKRFVDLIPESKRKAWDVKVKQFNERDDEI